MKPFTTTSVVTVLLIAAIAIAIALANTNGVLAYLREISVFVIGLIETAVYTNQLVQAIVFSGLSALLLCIGRIFYKACIASYFTKLTSSITIHNSDKNFHAVVDYLSDSFIHADASFSMRASTKEKNWSRKDWIQKYLGTDKRTIEQFEFRPDSDQVIHTLIHSYTHTLIHYIHYIHYIHSYTT